MNAMTDDDFAIKLGNRIRELRKIKGIIISFLSVQ